MKKIITAFSMMFLSIVLFAQSDYSQFTRDINNYSNNYSDDQVIGLYENHYGVPQNTLVQLFSGFGFNWGNVTLGLEMSHYLGIPVSDLLGIYRDNPKGNGWGVMAQRYGIKPGSAEFHRMKAMMSKKNRYWSNIYDDYRINRNPIVAQRNRIYFNNGLIRMRPLSSKEMKEINKQIDKRNKKIYKQETKMVKKWEKENKKIRKERSKQMKKKSKW